MNITDKRWVILKPLASSAGMLISIINIILIYPQYTWNLA